MDKEDLISVIVPCYNIEKYVSRCIESIMNQTYKDLEIIAVNDGSTDRTGEILDEMAKKDGRLLVRHFDNQGPSAARNRGLDLMTGSYVMCIDGDDFVDSSMIAKMYEKLEQTRVSMAACNFWLYYGEGNKKVGNPNTDQMDDMPSEMAIELLFDSSKKFCTPWGKLYRKELWDGLRYPENVQFGEDMLIAPLLFDRAKKICFLSDAYYYYNQEGESLVRSDFNINKLCMITACKYWVEFCNKKYPSIQEKAKWCYWERMINICTFLTDVKYTKEYKEYQFIIRENVQGILRSKIRYVDKVKALFIAYFDQATYKKIRMVLRK